MATLKLGAQGPDVKTLQQRLTDKGFNAGSVDGDFGLATEAALMAFERSANLLADGTQLTGRANYRQFGQAVGLGDRLLNEPDLACDRTIAAQLLAAFLKDKERPIKEAVLHDDLRAARRLVNGGRNGLDRFTDAFHIGTRLIV